MGSPTNDRPGTALPRESAASFRPFAEHLSRRRLPRDDAEHLIRLASSATMEVAAREDIIAQQTEPDRIHILLEGWACSYRLLSDGRRQIGAIHLAGDVCGVDALAPGRLAFGVIALTNCRLACLGCDALARAMEERPSVRDLVVALFAAENTVLAELVTNLGRRSARERTAFVLCRLLARLQENGEALDDTIRCALTQTDLADHLGLSTVHVNRALRDLKLRGLISGRGSVYAIRDLPALQAIASL